MPDSTPTLDGEPRRLPRATLRTYLVSIILLATIPPAVLMAWQLRRDTIEQQARRDERLQRRATALALVVERELVSSIDALKILSYREKLQQGDMAAFERALLSLPQLPPSWRSVFLTVR